MKHKPKTKQTISPLYKPKHNQSAKILTQNISHNIFQNLTINQYIKTSIPYILTKRQLTFNQY